MDEVSKRRRMPLSPLADENVDDEAVTVGKNDVKQDKATNPELSRREKLLKWREERKQKKGTEPQKKSFVVRHVKYEQEALLFANAMKKATKGVTPLIKPSQYEASKPAKRVTRASVRIAKQSANLATDFKTRGVKKVEPKPKPACSDKLKEKKTEVQPEKTGRVTRQSVRTKTSLSAKGVTASQSSKKAMAAELDNKVKTRSQAQKVKDQASSECHPPLKLDKQSGQISSTEEIKPAPEKLSFPPLENIENTVSLGRGSTEGVKRGSQPSTASRTEAQSFAPEDFQFTAPSGVNTFTYFAKAFKFQPLSPKSAAEFMFPTSAASFFSPKRDKPTDQVENAVLEDPVAACHLNTCNELKIQENNQQEQVHVEIDDMTGTCSATMETCNDSEKQQGDNEAVATITTPPSTDRETPSTQKSHETIGEVVTGMDGGDVLETQDVEEEQHDAKYFRNLVTRETDRLNEICAKWEKINTEEQGLSEEVTGQIRTTIGQAQLLIDQRFRQFSGLIDLSEDKHAEKPATVSDLQGFWEMIYFQVEDVNAKFAALEKLKNNNWKEEEKKTRKFTKKSKTKKPTPGNDAKPNNKLATARNRIQEMRMAMKAKMAADKEKLRAEKRHQEEEAFVTILTPVKKSSKSDGSDEVVLTPVRRSIRKTPQKRSILRNNTPVVVTTPKVISENSPGLRLTPDNHPNKLAITGTCMQVEDTSEMDHQLQEDEMQCDLEQQEPAVLKSACKPAENKSRKSSGTVTFQSPNPEESTPESAVDEVFCSPVVSTGLNGTGSFENRAKKSTPQRFSARKCRIRMGTPYYQERPRRRVSRVEEDAGHGTDSQGRSSSDSDSTDDKAVQRCPGSGLRRSARKTPSKYRDSTPLEALSDQQGKTPAEVSMKLFQATKESTTQETPKNGIEQDAFSKYLCPSSDEEYREKQTVDFDHKATENLLQDKETRSEDLVVSENVNLTPPEEPHNFIKPSITNSCDPKTGRTPIHILRYLSDMDTPSPNSRQITPMPKTTIFVSPSDSTKTPALTDSLGMMSPENVVRRFTAKTDGSPLLSLAPVAGKESHAAVTPCSQLAAFSLDESPVNNERRRDSVFFAPVSTAVVRAQDNLMSFSPVVEGKEADA